MPENEFLTFEQMPVILSKLRREIQELKELVIQDRNNTPVPDEWMDIDGLCEYHPNHPSKKTVYDWVTDRRIPYHKSGHRLRFRRSEIDEWLNGGYHEHDAASREAAINRLNDERITTRQVIKTKRH